MPANDQHVFPSGGKWGVRRAGAMRASHIYATEQEAIDRAKNLAQEEHAVLYIHGRDGRIRERNSYSRETSPQKG
jgi:hypothetical protein